jgi:hypothetical protein
MQLTVPRYLNMTKKNIDSIIERVGDTDTRSAMDYIVEWYKLELCTFFTILFKTRRLLDWQTCELLIVKCVYLFENNISF